MYRDVNDFKMGSHPVPSIVKDEEVYLVADSHSILSRLKNHFPQLLKVPGVNDFKET